MVPVYFHVLWYGVLFVREVKQKTKQKKRKGEDEEHKEVNGEGRSKRREQVLNSDGHREFQLKPLSFYEFVLFSCVCV